jgi:uncharacterized membrane protein YphA (DoxX/SURF4 family)
LNTRLSEGQPKTSLFWVALLRIMLGVLFITQWYSNLTKGLYTPEGLEGLFNYFFDASDTPLLWYEAFINSIVLPNAGIYGPFQLVTELLMGLALLIGFLTPLTSVAAAFFVLNTFLASWGADWPWSYLTILGILGVLFFTRAGRSMGVDGRLQKRYGDRKFPLW